MRRCERESEIQGQSLRPCRAWSFRFAQGCPRKIYGRPRDRKSPSQFRLGRAWPRPSTFFLFEAEIHGCPPQAGHNEELEMLPETITSLSPPLSPELN